MTLLLSSAAGFSGTYAGAGKFDSIILDSTNQDVTLARLAAASLRLGAAPSATPVAQTLTIGEASRPSTDTNVAGASGTIRSGLGTGDATGSSLLLQTATAVASGSTTQTYATRLTITSTAITVVPQLLIANGTGAAPGVAFAATPGTGILSSFTDQLGFATSGVERWAIAGDGKLLPFADNAYDIGETATTYRPRNLRVGTNVNIGGGAVGTSGVGVLALGNGTEPSTSPADSIQLYSVDLSANNATLGLRTETAVAADVALASTHSLTVRINGANYKLMLVSV